MSIEVRERVTKPAKKPTKIRLPIAEGILHSHDGILRLNSGDATLVARVVGADGLIGKKVKVLVEEC